MTRIFPLLIVLAAFGQAACLNQTAMLEREVERTFRTAAGATVRVELSGAGLTVATGEPGTVHVSLRQAVYSNDRDAADRLLADYDVSVTADGSDVLVVGRRKDLLGWARWGGAHVRVTAVITAPPDVALDLGTSGGRITISGDRTADVRATTSGGSIAADGGTGNFALNTSGGGISVERALGRLAAETSGGSIRVAYVAPSSPGVDLATSGGSIRVGIDPAAAFALAAGTSGGSVRLDELPFEAQTIGRTHADGTINGGGATLRVTTSGGSIRLTRALDPGPARPPATMARAGH